MNGPSICTSKRLAAAHVTPLLLLPCGDRCGSLEKVAPDFDLKLPCLLQEPNLDSSTAQSHRRSEL